MRLMKKRRGDGTMLFDTRRNTLTKVLLATAFLFVSGFAQASEITIVKSDHSVEEISKRDLKKILEGKSKTWDDGTAIILVTLKDGKAHEAFLKKYAKKSAKQFTNYWRKMVFSGQGKMPQAFDSEDELAAFVAANPGSIGYIAKAPPDGTKELKIK